MNRQALTMLFFLVAGFITSLGVLISELGQYHGGLSTIVGIGFTVAMCIGAYLEYRKAGLVLHGLRKTQYFKYDTVELEWYQSASTTMCGCCGGPFMILAVLFISSGYENSPIVFSLFLIGAVLAILGGITTEHSTEGED
jgi:hypothetical protein